MHTTPTIAERLNAAIDQAIADARIVGTVVLVSRDDERIYQRAAGLADRESGQLMQDDLIFSGSPRSPNLSSQSQPCGGPAKLSRR